MARSRLLSLLAFALPLGVYVRTVQYDVANAFRAVGRLADARHYLLAVVSITPWLSQAHHALGQVAFGLGQDEEAEQHLQRALKGGPEPGSVLQHPGRGLRPAGQAGTGAPELDAGPKSASRNSR